jgi:hypothetical protein
MLESGGLAPTMIRIRTIAVALLALLAAWQVIRSAFVQAYGADEPAKAAALWPSHPDILFKTALDEIANAAATGHPVPRQQIEAIYAAAARAPLAPEPFLVRGVDAQLAGNPTLAGRAFEAARQRDPRSLAAHYFLADHFLRTGQFDAGIAELARLTQLVPGGIGSVAGYYAQYAMQPGGAARMKEVLRIHPEFSSEVLGALATDATNADLVLYLAGDRLKSSGEPPQWHSRLVSGLVAAGQFRKARTVWSKLSGEMITDQPSLFDPQFSGKKAPPPFNWSLLSTASGVAEEQGNGRLHLIYYGRDNATLASQTLTLPPGRYRLSFKIDGAGKGVASLTWNLSCLPSNRTALSLALPKSGTAAGQFTIGVNCPAQQLALTGTSPDFPQTIDLTLSDLALSRIAS